MIQGALYEESAVSTKSDREIKIYNLLNILQWIFMIIAGLLIMFSLLVVPNMISELKGNVPSLVFTLVTWFGGILSVGFIAFVFRYFKMRRNVSFDYIFVEDELRISKVFNGRKRKPLHKLLADQMLKIGYCDRPSFEKTCAGLSKKQIRIRTPNDEPADGKVFLYILYSSSIEKAVYVIECREMMLEYLVRAAGRNKFERQ